MRDSQRVASEFADALAEANLHGGLREQYRVEAVKAGKILDQQTLVVRNLRARIEDPTDEYLRHGAKGGVFTPLGKQVF